METASPWSRIRRAAPRLAAWGRPPALLTAALVLLALTAPPSALWAATGLASGAWPWWSWPLAMFLGTVALGVLTVPAGIGGSVVFVPLVAGIAPQLHLDFIRGTGLMVALAGALSAGPTLIHKHLINLRLTIPLALTSSLGSVVGAHLGLSFPAAPLQLALGVVILIVGAVMLFTNVHLTAPGHPPDWLASRLGIQGHTWDELSGQWQTWEPKSMVAGLVLFVGIGLIGGMFGLGAGWANVPVLNLVMGVPLRAAVGTSYFLLAASGSTAAWVYLNQGALLPILVIPALMGIMLGARLGAWVLARAHPRMLRWIVIATLILSGLRSILQGSLS